MNEGAFGSNNNSDGFFECLRMLIIPRNSLKFRLLVDSNLTHRKHCRFEGKASRTGD